jgi:NADPH-dependent 2,4-dienoyl-CoA reductase/sulfur reductase-like enzyme/Fe-S-cluster-containing hydrogenase component 2/bacterioferritin-associated ferredoxin
VSNQHRITAHPILAIPLRREVPFTFNGRALLAYDGEVISSALIANGVSIFGHHHKDGGAQGIFCANGQCSQCLVLANDVPVKSCMVQVTPGVRVRSLAGLPKLPADDSDSDMSEIPLEYAKVLIVGGGPAGISAAIELGRAGIETLLIDDKSELGGKLTLQTHGFFGSVADCWAGTRGIEIAKILTSELERHPSVKVWLNASAVALFEDRKLGVVRDGRYVLVEPELILIATGAREKNLAFPGCDLPGVYGAGAFQTLVNRDLVRSAERLFIVGGGNVGLIAGYHALQAGIEVVGLVEALPKCGGYKVHEDKLRRLGVPIRTSHTVLHVDGHEKAESVTICAIDDSFKPIPGTEHTYQVDTVLIAVGLSPVDELLKKARAYGVSVWAAGDAEEIAEASAAIFSGKISGRKILEHLGLSVEIPDEWNATARILRSRPGPSIEFEIPEKRGDVYPVIRCVQEIPCNPCIEACPINSLEIADGNIMLQPAFHGPQCVGCSQCVAACPGLAIVLVDERADPSHLTALITMPWEFSEGVIRPGDRVQTVGFEAEPIGTGLVKAVKRSPAHNRRRLVLVEVPWLDRHKVAAFKIQPEHSEELPGEAPVNDDVIICRCERVTKREIVEQIRSGVHDFNQLKATVRSGMGACGGKTCRELIYRILREEGVDLKDTTPFTERPFLAEVPLKYFAGTND